MFGPRRMSPAEVRGKLQAGKALLVCAYASEVNFRQTALEGAISFSEFENRKASLPRETELVFY